MQAMDAASGVATEDRYFASDSPDGLEHERMRCLAAMLDPVTTRHLELIDVREGWSCLEVAAGSGSIAAWLGARVGTEGAVRATDLNPRFLRHLKPPVNVDRLDLLTDEIEGTFDLVHGRMILMHLPKPESVLSKLVAAVKPGGWLCIEEGDYDTVAAMELDDPDAAAWTDQIQATFRKAPTHERFGRRIRSLLEDLGLENVGSDGVTWVWRGGEAGARFMELSSAAFHAAGGLTEAEHALTSRLMSDPRFFFKDMTLFGAWGRKASR